ncbi:MAG: copper resistance protein NlpE N-terminal domain-containing protein [Chitinophagaceae bacterium]|nr:copper resistance protein NlpE N-terminal domain-containing protein [Chitinophagaceae bacterium]MCW5926267.1 copper resistance protein NlpE N-terminal domain-containing protein [Chitinophagaceae bacterium]
MKRAFPFLGIMLVLIACNSRPENDPMLQETDTAFVLKGGREFDSAQLNLVGKFEGVLPCADCRGIKTELTLYQNIGNVEYNVYILKETYLTDNTGDTAFTTQGKWDVLKGGVKGNDSATIFFLNYDEPDDSRYFLEVGPDIQMLDKDHQIIESAASYVLRRKE